MRNEMPAHVLPPVVPCLPDLGPEAVRRGLQHSKLYTCHVLAHACWTLCWMLYMAVSHGRSAGCAKIG